MRMIRNLKVSNRFASLIAIIFSLFLTLTIASPAYAISSVSIGNGPAQSNGSYLNAQNIADNLVFTSIVVQAQTSIDIVDPIDLSTSTFGTPHFNLSISAPICNINNSMNLSALGHLNLNCGTLNLNAKITSGGTTINPSRISGFATQVNILSNNADIQQGIDDSSN